MPHAYALVDEQREQFDDAGYLLLPGLLPPAVLDGLRASFSRVVDRLADRWHARGLVSDTFPDLPFGERYLQLLKSNPIGVPAAWRRILVSRSVYQLWQRPELLGPVRSILGDEVFAHGVWNGRPRDPFGRSQQVSWHQDAYYYKNWDPAVGPLLSAWIPLVPVDERRSCMQYVTGSHKNGWMARRRLENGEYGAAEEPDEGEVYTARMNPGDVIVFADTTLHRSTANTSNGVRWSIDIRFGRAVAGVIDNSPRGYRCFSAKDPDAVESFEAWAQRYRYEPEELLTELTNFEEGYDIETLTAFSQVSPYADVY